MTDAVQLAVIAAPPASRNPVLAVLRAVLRHRLSRAGLAIIVLLCVLAIFAPLLAPYDPYDQDLYLVLAPPSATHWLGTDNLGRDLFSRLLYGTQVSLFVGIFSSLVSAVLGVLVGLFAGFRGGVTDAIIMRITDAFLCFPPLIFILAMSATLGPIRQAASPAAAFAFATSTCCRPMTKLSARFAATGLR
jgi:ABC-type dipeptide/oligopeptide/nickel transport system permease subunit